MIVHGRVIRKGHGRGVALVSPEPIGLLGGVDADTGMIIEKGHALEGETVAGCVLVFPAGKGSTVGSYTLLRLVRNGRAPAAIINAESEPIVAIGAVLADIPMVDHIDTGLISTGDLVIVDGERVEIKRKP